MFRFEGGFERLFFFILLFLTLTHINACMWVFMARFDEDRTDDWISQKEWDGLDNTHLYIASFYFVVTTITTVGFGDISGFNTYERLFCCFLMLIGVLAFSYSTSSLSLTLS